MHRPQNQLILTMPHAPCPPARFYSPRTRFPATIGQMADEVIIAPDSLRTPPVPEPLSPASVTSNGHPNAREVYERIAANIAQIMKGQAPATRKLLAALASGGHVLLEDFPGTGK